MTAATTTLPHCRFCATPLTTTLCDLGSMPLANDYRLPDDSNPERSFPLHARVCPSCLLVQVDDSVPPDAIFSDYAYFSSYSDSWVAHAKRYADAMIERFGLGANSLVVEIASNDGYLLQHFKAAGVPVLGVEPAANVAETARAKGIDTEVAFFGVETARRLVGQGKRADLMAANNVLAHVPDISDFVGGFATLLKPEGVVTFEFPHVLNLIEKVQFDTIYHEHFSYLSLVTVEKVFAAVGLKAIDVEELPTHGGSLRLFAAPIASSHQPSARLDALRAKEHAAGLDTLAGYEGFAAKVAEVKRGFLAFLAEAKAAGKTIAAYGAAAKGNTFLNFCGVGPADIVAVFDRSLAKQGRLLPGSQIPILSPDKISEIAPDYLVILPWNIAEEVMEQTRALMPSGSSFVTAVPSIRLTP
ncbi:SAM-dependent methyltransferase [Labrys sp. WJW]|uniref:class I SAM-dependent methyltransferase n=1 Tax=Labrys sp. WJW TaxID=1737983 RepID=UPI00082DEE70|nr:class I SAM-dependent methyltransferase [Labrys sp. WJW]OCC01559.1 SAM-dependent methyltransferase [Labrys sp. WJW]